MIRHPHLCASPGWLIGPCATLMGFAIATSFEANYGGTLADVTWGVLGMTILGTSAATGRVLSTGRELREAARRAKKMT